MKKFVFGLAMAVLLGGCGGESGSPGPAPISTATPTPTPSPTPTRIGPNVVFIIADDLNTYVQGYGGHPQAYTPNLTRLMERGVTFTAAQANGSACSPSRASFLSGYLPSSSGKHHSNMKFRDMPLLAEAKLLPEHFRDQGYAVYSAGKIFHDTDRENQVFGTSDPATQPTGDKAVEGGYMGPKPSFGPYPWDGVTREWHRPSRNIPFGDEGVHWERNSFGGIRLLEGGRWNTNPDLPDGLQGWALGFGRLSRQPLFSAGMNSAYPAGWNMIGWGDYHLRDGRFQYQSGSRDLIGDELIAGWAAATLRGDSYAAPETEPTAPIDGREFMMMLGLTKTHQAWYIPDEYFDAVIQANGIRSINDVQLPPSLGNSVTSDDLNDVPPSLRPYHQMTQYRRVLDAGAEGGTLPDLVNPGEKIANTPENLVRSIVLAYLAAVYTVDYQLGQVLDAIDADPDLRDNTIIVFTSDHGFHLGEKMSFTKGTRWNETFHIPLIIADPNPQFDASRGMVSTIPVSLVDLYPTLTDLAGLPAVPLADGSPPLDGQSLKPALLAPASPVMAKTPLGLGSTYFGVADSPNVDPAKHAYSLRTQRYRYILSPRGDEELYDRELDPYEHTNVANDPAYEDARRTANWLLKQAAGF